MGSDTLSSHITPGETPGGILTWTATIPAPGGVWVQQVIVTVVVNYEGPLTNEIQVTTHQGATGLANVTVWVDVYRVYLPLVLR